MLYNKGNVDPSQFHTGILSPSLSLSIKYIRQSVTQSLPFTLIQSGFYDHLRLSSAPCNIHRLQPSQLRHSQIQRAGLPPKMASAPAGELQWQSGLSGGGNSAAVRQLRRGELGGSPAAPAGGSSAAVQSFFPLSYFQQTS